MEWLKEILGEELFNQVCAKLGDRKVLPDDGSFIPKHRLDEVIGQRDSYKAQVEETAKQLKELEKAAKGNEALAAQIRELEDAKAKAEKAAADVSLKSAVKLAAVRAKAKDPDDILKFVDTSKLTLEGENVKGLDEALKELAEKKAYLFEQEETPPSGNPANPALPPDAAKAEQAFRAALG